MNFPIKTKMYLHGEKETNLAQGEELGLPESALENFKYALYEVEFDVEIDERGEVKILNVNGEPVGTTPIQKLAERF